MTRAPATALQRIVEGGRPLAALVIMAVGIKVVVALSALGADPLTTNLVSDSRYYVERALGLAGRWVDPLAAEPYHLPPLYPRILSLVPGVATGSLIGALLLQALVGALTVVGVYLLARRRASRPAAFAAALIVLAYGPLTFFETRLLGDSLAAGLFVGLCLLGDAVDSAKRPLGWAVALGIVTSLAALLRPQALLLIPVLALWLGRRHWSLGVGCLLAALVTLVPSTLHNQRAGAGLVPVSDNGGVNLWLAATGPVTGTFETHLDLFADIGNQATAARAVAESLTGGPVAPDQVSGILRAEAWRATWDDPLTAARRVGWRARALTESFETGIVAVPSVEMGLIPPLRILALPFGLVLGLWVVAVALGRRRPGSDPEPTRPAPLVPLAAVAGMVVVTTLVFFHYSRFRLPLVPVLAVGIACGWDRWGNASVGRRALAVVLGVAVAGLSWLPAPHHATTRAAGWSSLAEARLRSAPPNRPQATEAALADAQAALAAQPGFVRAELLAAECLRRLLRFEEAGRHLDRVAEHLPDHPPMLLERAWLLATPHPENTRHDTEAARDVIHRLRLATADDAELQASLNALEARLGPN